jgi:hypothetical protein
VSAGRYIVLQGQIRQELFQLFLARKLSGHFLDRRHVTAEPKEVTILGRRRLVLTAERFPCPFNRLSSIHFYCEILMGALGQGLSNRNNDTQFLT